MRCGFTLALGRTGFRPGSRGPFVSAKGPKTTFAQVGTLDRSDASHGGADQLAGLKQDPLFDLSVSPVSRLAGGGSLSYLPNLQGQGVFSFDHGA